MDRTLLIDRGLAEKADMGWQRRLGAHDAALALEAFEQRGFLAADIGARADAQFDVEVEARALDVLAEPARFVRLFDRGLKHLGDDRIFRAQIDIALGAADGVAADGHALDERERIALHDHAIGEGAGIAFVGVDDDIFLTGRTIRHRLPLDAGREARAAAAAKA